MCSALSRNCTGCGAICCRVKRESALGGNSFTLREIPQQGPHDTEDHQSLTLFDSPMKLLRTFPPLGSREIVPLVVQFIGAIPASLYDAIVRHPWDDSLVIPLS